MKRQFTLLIFLMTWISVWSQHTFSIVAIDTLTGEVGSAGATCLTSADCGNCGGAVIISELIPGIGAINAQAQICLPNVNLSAAISHMADGNSAESTLDYILQNDMCSFGNEEDRQYGMVSFHNGVMSRASFTGSTNSDYAGHRNGKTYSIQGNILLGPEILNAMESGFLNSEGQSLAERLMACMQGANVPGADSRCLSDGISSKSSFIRVARPGDLTEYWLDIIIGETDPGVDPIDVLQNSFDDFTISSEEIVLDYNKVEVFPNPTSNQLQVIYHYKEPSHLQLFNLDGKRVFQQEIENGTNHLDLSSLRGNTRLMLCVIESGHSKPYTKLLVLND